MRAIAVAALSARTLAEAAAREGIGAVALDLFGDCDTRRAASQWFSIGKPAALRIDASGLLDVLQALALRGQVQGWVAGAGFDGRTELLEQGAACLPLLGTAPADVRRVRDPAGFFGFLQSHGIHHPPVRYHASDDTAGWLFKDAGASGGWHILRAADAAGSAASPLRYWQREVSGTAMSATFIANGGDAVLLGHNEQIVRTVGVRPFVFCGVCGPVPVPAAVACQVGAAVRALAAAFGLRGLCSLDYMLDGERAWVLEVNPRPSASMALYPDVGSVGVLRAHLRACLHDELPAPPRPAGSVGGNEIVVAPRVLRLDEAAAATLAAWPDVHDLPHAATLFAAGDPLCSVTARGPDADSVKIGLARQRDAVLQQLETVR
ncbi:MAG TPA: ATP-grasp domain-containing protein [Burkholderiaceae bacterium]|nr:ATP-grasp domain-containing protein [Burkholderiaceae bacterium]